jgi:hypothetical protein
MSNIQIFYSSNLLEPVRLSEDEHYYIEFFLIINCTIKPMMIFIQKVNDLGNNTSNQSYCPKP